MMRSILLLGIGICAKTKASAAEDFVQHNPTAIEHVENQGNVGLRGLASWKRVPGQATPYTAEMAGTGSVNENDNNDEDYVWELDEEVGGGEEEVTILFEEFDNDKKRTEEIVVRRKKQGDNSGKEKNKKKKNGGKKKKKNTVEVKVAQVTPDPTPSPITSTADEVVHKFPTFSPVVVTEDEEIAPFDATTTASTPEPETNISTRPTCPAHYSTSITYAEGDTIEENSHIYQCQSYPYESYCNIIQIDNTWDDTEKVMWRDAWKHVHACEKVEEIDDAAVFESMQAPSTPSFATTTSFGTTTKITTTEATTTGTTTTVPPCPSDYDFARIDYTAGEQVTVKSHIFKCNEEDGYELYCNTAAWDGSLLSLDENAEAMWHSAWVGVGECAPTQEELMEEEVDETP